MRMLVAGLMIAMHAAAFAGDVDNCALFTLPGKGEPRVLPVAVSIDGDSPEVIWRKYLQRHFEFFDRNGDERLAAAEFAKMLPLPTEKVDDLAAFDANGDGEIKWTEFAAAGKRAFPAFSAWTAKPDEQDIRLGAIFAAALDTDHDGQIDRADCASLGRALRPYDLNEDECLELKELLADFAMPAKETPRKTVELFFSPVALQLDLGASPTVKMNKDFGLRRRDAAGDAKRLVLGDLRGEWILLHSMRQEIPDVKSSADFLLAQHADAVGNNESLARADFVNNPALGAIGQLFLFADRNDDNQLTADELRAYLDLIRDGVAAQTTITLRDHGGDLFPLLDLDGDQKLMPAELARVGDLFAGESTRLPTVLTLEIGAVSLPTWGAVRLSAAKPKKAVAPAEPSPAWFNAQDRNSDGQLSPREFVGNPELFRKFDADKNGLISPDEIDTSKASATLRKAD